MSVNYQPYQSYQAKEEQIFDPDFSIKKNKHNPSSRHQANYINTIRLESIVEDGMHGAVGAQLVLFGIAAKISELVTTSIATGFSIVGVEIARPSGLAEPISVIRAASTLAGATAAIIVTNVIEMLPEAVEITGAEGLPAIGIGIAAALGTGSIVVVAGAITGIMFGILQRSYY